MSRSTKSTCHLAVVRRLLLLFLLGSGLSLNLHGQVVGGTIQGMTTDPNGAALPSVKVEIVNLSTQILTTLTSNAEGFYTAPNLLPGEYKVSATRSGFATPVTQLTLAVGAQRELNMAWKLGATAGSRASVPKWRLTEAGPRKITIAWTARASMFTQIPRQAACSAQISGR